jgi:hypothetical protein
MISNAAQVRGLIVRANPKFGIIIACYPKGVIACGRWAYVAPYTYAVVIQNIEGSFKGSEGLGIRWPIVEVIGIVA